MLKNLNCRRHINEIKTPVRWTGFKLLDEKKPVTWIPSTRNLPKWLKVMLQDFHIQKDAPQNHILKTLASSYNHMKKKS